MAFIPLPILNRLLIAQKVAYIYDALICINPYTIIEKDYSSVCQ